MAAKERVYRVRAVWADRLDNHYERVYKVRAKDAEGAEALASELVLAEGRTLPAYFKPKPARRSPAEIRAEARGVR